MAEFQEVMRQVARYCSAQTGCANCKLYEIAGVRCPSDMFTADNGASIEEVVMSWAEEHPEPVYPTWYEYLNKMYGAAFGDLRVIGRQPISADIAQKLGIKPKEVKCDETT